MTEPPFVFLTDADSMPSLVREGTVAILLITRGEIERGTIGDVVDRLMAMSDNAASCRHLAGSVVIQVDGYNEDPRELMEIVEVREFFQKVNKEWSYWAHFLNHSITDSFNLLLSLVLEPTRQVLGNRVIGVGYRDADIEGFLTKQLENVFALCSLHGLDDQEAFERFKQLLSAMTGSPREMQELLKRVSGSGLVDF